MASLPSASTILLAVSLMKGVEGAVTVSGSGGAGIPNQQALTLRCSYTVTPGDVVTGYTWRMGEGLSAVQIATGSVPEQTAVFLDSWQNKGVFVGDYTSSLDIRLPASHVTSSYAGTYRCEVSGLSDTGQVSVTASVLYAPSIFGLPTVQNISEFSSLRIDCSTYTTPGNTPTTSYTWTYGGSTVSTGAVLDRISISRNQGGNYTCTASNTLTPSGGSQQQGTATAQVNVNVQYQASISIFTANSLSSTLTVNESDTVTLRCQIDSNPRSIIRLQNGTEELTRADNSLTAEYRLESADCRQRGNYSCTATNSIGAPVSQRVELLVNFPPRLDESVPQQLKYAARLGGNVSVSVSVLAFPLPTFTWSRTTSSSRDLTGSSSPVSDISVTARLHLTNLQLQDFGDYRLTVDNRVGRSVAYTVSLKLEGPPGTPTQFKSLENVTTSSVWLSWQPGFNGGHPQSFMLEYLQFVTRTWTAYNTYDDNGKVKVVEVTGLTSGDMHLFRLHSRNALSNSLSFVIVETVTAGDPTDHQQLDATCTEDIVGSTVGTLLLALFIGGIVVMVLYRKGFRFEHAMKGTASPKSTSRAEDTEMDNIGYSSLDTINSPAQYTSLEEKAPDKQNYSQLKIYENTKEDAPADTSTYEGMAETPPVTYESINASPDQDSGGQPRDADYGNI